MDNTLRLIEALTPIIQSLVWPLFLLFLMVCLKEPLKQFFANISEFKLKAAGVEASAISHRKQIKAAAYLGAAASKSDEGDAPSVDTSEIADVVSDFARTKSKQGPARILWVDDIPSNNYFEREALEQMGIEFGIAKSTEEALSKLEVANYDLIISDMGRPPDARAGYTLLDQLRKSGSNKDIPFVIYASSRQSEHLKESVERGAIGCTNRPDELFVLVSQGLVLASR